MKTSRSINCFFLITILVSINACEKENIDSRDYPRLRTSDVTEISSSGVKFNAEIFFNDGMKIIDHGFVWGTINNPGLNASFENLSLGSFKGTGEYSSTSTYGMEMGSILYVRAYLITKNYTVYGNVIQFTSKGCEPPILNDYTPKSASMMDTITINGQNFSSRYQGNMVYFNEIIARVIEYSNEQLKLIVPFDLTSVNPTISVVSSGYTSEATSPFSLLIPEFTDFNPKTVSIGQYISITGNNISPRAGLPNEVWFGDKRGIVRSATRNELIVEVPGTITSATEILRVTSFPTEKEFPENFQLAPPTIQSFSPSSGGPNTKVTVSGEGFHHTGTNNEIRLGSVPISLSESYYNTLKFVIPPDIGLITGDYKISVTTLGLITEAIGFFHYIAP